MSKKKTGIGIAGVIGVGLIAYALLKGKSANQTTSQSQPETTQSISIIPEIPDNADFAPTVTPDLLKEIQSFGITSGSAITNIIHGGTPCGYRGTNGKCYSSFEEAQANGAA